MSESHSKTYTIVNKLTSQPIGCRNAEDLNNSPKAVVNREKGLEPQKWVLEAVGDGRFHLLILGSPTTVIDEKVYALLVGKEKAVSWSLNPQPQHGRDVFTIEIEGEGGWVLLSEDPETQIALQPLVVAKSLPPQYQPSALWVITPLLE